MSFLSAYHDRRRDEVLVWERNASGVRTRKVYDAPRYFYVPDRLGDFESITGIRLKKLTFSTRDDYDQTVLAERSPFEADFEPDERVLMDNYSTVEPPVLRSGLIDIEVDYNPSVGFAGPKDPYAPINALTLYFVEHDRYVTLAVPPKGWDNRPLPDDLAHVIICKDERELLDTFLDLFHEVDLVSGWNSEFFDIPYIGRRVQILFGEEALHRLGFEGGPLPKWGEKVRFKFGSVKDPVLNLISRPHLDYLRLFKKFNLTTRQSFSLEAVGMDELGIPKLKYDGTLHGLYNNDFIKFLQYNTHDVRLIKLLDDKYKYIELANRMVHEATVNFEAVFGSVMLIDTAITNFAHNKLKKIVTNRVPRPEGDPVEGALVVTPKPGFYEWVGACDINSLYPSTIRSLNLSPEKLVGQVIGLSETPITYAYFDGQELRRFSDDPPTEPQTVSFSDLKAVTAFSKTAQHKELCKRFAYDVYERSWRLYRAARSGDAQAQATVVTVRLEGSDETVDMSMGDLVELCDEKRYAMTGFGTIVDQSTGEGLVSAVLSSWFKGRKEMQAEKKRFGKLKGELLKQGRAKDDPEVVEAARQEAYYDMLQGVRKVLLNSTYGAMLNEYSRFGDPRIGASVTYTGRQITTHMIHTVFKALVGEDVAPPLKLFDPTEKKDSKTGADGEHDRRWGANSYQCETIDGLGPIYGDTDSVYFTMKGAVKETEEAVATADAVADHVNASFPGYMRQAFNCQPSFDELIKTNRELVCRTGIIQAKKKYMMAVVDKEGKRIKLGDDDELKTMGSDIKLSSTPEIIRALLTDVVMKILNKRPKAEIDKTILDFRSSLKMTGDDVTNPLEIATVQSIKELEEATLKWRMFEQKGLGKAKLAANARAAINYNYLLEKHKLTGEPTIIGGQKIKILWLKSNEEGLTNIAFPSDFDELPKWFTDRYEVDMKLMEEKLVDQKLANIFDALEWEVPTFQSRLTNTLLEF